MVNCPELVCNVDTADTVLSDHKVNIFTYYASDFNKHSKTKTKHKDHQINELAFKFKEFNYYDDRCDWLRFNLILSKIEWYEILNNADSTAMLNIIYSILLVVSQKTIPLRKKVKKQKNLNIPKIPLARRRLLKKNVKPRKNITMP